MVAKQCMDDEELRGMQILKVMVMVMVYCFI